MIQEGTLKSYDIQKQKLTKTKIDNIKHARGFQWLELSGSQFPGQTLTFITKDSTVHKYNPETNHYEKLQNYLPGEAIKINSLAEGPDGNIYAGGGVSGGLSSYNPDLKEIEEFKGINQIEGMTAHKGKLYMGVYTDGYVYSYDPKKPFEMGKNPFEEFNMKEEQQNRPYEVISAGNYVAIGSVPVYGKLGGALSLLNTNTGEHEVHRNIVEDHSVISLAYHDGYIYGGTSSTGAANADHPDEDGVLFIWDTETKEKIFETIPLKGEQGISALEIDDEGNLWGLTAGKIFKFDTTKKEVVGSKEYFPYEWKVDRLFHGYVSQLKYDDEDGYIYGKSNDSDELLFRIDPLTWEKETLLEDDILSGNENIYQTLENKDHFYFSKGTVLYEYTVPHAKSLSKQLNESLEKANDLDSSAYTKSSWTELESAMNKAEKLLDQTKVDKDKITNAKNALEQGIDALEEKKETDKQELRDVINGASALKEDDFTEKSWSSFEIALTKAQEVLEDEKATQETVDDVLDDLTKQMNELEKKEDKKEPNKEDLRDIISDAEKKKDSDYTSDSWDKFQKALGSAKEALKNNNVSQKEVDQALTELKNAEKGLTLDEQNDSSGGVVDKNKIDSGNQTQKDDKGDTLPSTATNLYNYLLIGFILLAAGITLTIIHLRKRKRQHS